MIVCLQFAVFLCIIGLQGLIVEESHMYLKRKIDGFLQDWKTDEARKPLIVRGSRQVGKTEADP